MNKLIIDMLMKSHSVFYGLFLSEIEIKYSKQIPTACISWNKHTSKSEMIFNPEFISTLNNAEITFLLRHELEHYINCHYFYTSEFGWDKEVSNISMDLSINSGLLHFCSVYKDANMSMPKGGLTPSSFPEFKLEELRESKYYYDILIQKKDKKEKEGSSGSKSFDELLDSGDDMHPLWATFSELETLGKELVKTDLGSKISEILKDTEKLKGISPLNILNPLDILKIKKPVISWTNFFRLFIGSSISSIQEQTRKRPNKRFEDSFGNKMLMKSTVFAAYDSSGSICDTELQKFNNEILHMYKSGSIIYKAAWDQECEIPTLYKGNFKTLNRTKSGGTNIDCAIIESNKSISKLKHDVLLILTDGYVGEITVKSKRPVLIVLTPGGNEYFDNPYNYKIIKINE